ncbi:MAG: C25 family cysteine peptidase [bacterium]
MWRFLRWTLFVCMFASMTDGLFATSGSGELVATSNQLSVFKIRSTGAGAELAVREAVSSSEGAPGPVADGPARPFSAGLLWVLPSGTAQVTVEAIPLAWRSPEPGEVSDSLVEATVHSPVPLAAASVPAIMRGIPLATFSLNALQPAEDGQGVRICTDYRVNISYQRSNAPMPIGKRSATFYDLVASMAGNLDELPPQPAHEPEPYLVVYRSGTPVAPIQDFANWKRQRGHMVTVVSTNEIGGTTREQIRNYIQNAYNTWEEPPVFVVLIGDVNGSYAIPTYMIDGTYTPLICTDHPYALLEGDDYLPDILVGRLSVDSESELRTVVAKTVTYEKTPYEPDGAWRTRALMVGVTDYYGSYTSAWQTKLWVRDRLLDHGYTDVATVSWPGGSAYQIRQNINSGVSFVNYRGFGSPEGWAMPSYLLGDIEALGNGWKLPVVTSMVCGGGDFVSNVDPCFGEAWIRYGTEQNPKGAVAFCGPSEHDTKTRWNNTLDAGLYYGVLYDELNTFGAALLRGKMELMRQFPMNLGPGTSDNSVHFYFHTYNILGDPGLTFFVGTPRQLNANVAATLPLGQPTLDIVATSAGAPLAEAWATTMVNGAVYSRGLTEADGRLSLPIPQSGASSVTVTVTKPLYRPVIQTVTLTAPSGAFVSTNATDLADDGSQGSSGNGDGKANPGEVIALRPHLHNFGNATFPGGSLILRSLQPTATVLDSLLTVPSMAPSGDALPGYVRCRILRDVSDGTALHLEWRVSPGEFRWTQDIEVYGPALEVSSMRVGGEMRPLEPGETALVSLSLANSGRASLPASSASLRSLTPTVEVLDSTATFAEVPPGDSLFCDESAFQLRASSSLIPGDQASLLLVISTGNEPIFVPFSISIGELEETDPSAPDAYGYRAFEDTDAGYEVTPAYAWVEINPMEGGPGTTLTSLTDTEEGDDKSATVTLPFPVTYYGETYSEITICTNGWVAMGRTDREDFRNYALPAPLSPLTLIAVFWDDLVTVPQGRICTWYDAVGHRFVVEWSHLRQLSGQQDQTFQVIFFDADCWPTTTEDSEILFQYKSVSNSDSYENFAAVGIQKPDLSTAVLISHAGISSPGCGTLRPNKAILFSTGRRTNEAYLQWSAILIDDDASGGSNGNGDGIAQNGETVELSFVLRNNGQMSSPATVATVRESDPYATLLDSIVSLPSIPPGQAAGSTPVVRLQILPSCPNGRSVNFLILTSGGIQPCVLLPSLRVVGPVLSVLSPQIDDDGSGGSNGNGNSEFNPGERIELIPGVVNMGGSPAYGVVATLSRISGPVTVLDASATLGDISIGEQVFASDPAIVQVSSSAHNGDLVALRFVVRDEYGTQWQRDNTYMVVLPLLAPAWARIADPPPEGNGDGFLLPGEGGQLYLVVANDGYGTATNVHATLASMDSDVTLLDSEVWIGTVSGNSEREAQTPVRAVISSGAVVPRNAHLSVALFADDGISESGDIYITLGNAFFFNDFENPYTANWGHAGNNDRWHLQTHDCASDSHAFYFGDDGSRTYPVLSQGSLFSTAFSFGGHGTVQFKTRYHTQAGRDYCQVDLQVGSTSWMPLLTLSGHQEEWTQIVIPLEDYPTYSSARLRFTFQSDASVNDEGFYLDDVIILDETISGLDDEAIPEFPGDFVLEQNWPNPFNSETSFRYGLPSRTWVRVAVYDILGREVAVLVNEERQAGFYEARWRPKEAPTGLYFARISAGSTQQVRKMLLLK